MLVNSHRVLGYRIRATDGEIGKVRDFYFDDQKWTVRWIVVDTGSWLVEREVLLPPAAAKGPDTEAHDLPTDLSIEQVENSPPVERDLPVSQVTRQHEVDILGYYGWTPYWGPPLGPVPLPGGDRDFGQAPPERNLEERPTKDYHLRSMVEVEGYHLRATDGSIGHVESFLLDTDGWVIRYLVIDTRNWLPGRRVLISPHWVQSVTWGEREVHLGYDRAHVEASPEYDPSAPPPRAHEEELHDHYEQPRYWE